MQQDDQPNAEQTAEIPAPDAQVVAPAPGKKGGKQAAAPANPAPDGGLSKLIQQRADRLESHVADVAKGVKATGVTAVALERSLDTRLGSITDDVEAMRILMLDIDKRFKALEAESSKRDSRLLQAVGRYEASVLKSLEATVAACEALTGLRPDDARTVRRFVADIRGAREKQAPTPPSPASRPTSRAAWTVAGVAGAVVLGLCWLLLT